MLFSASFLFKNKIDIKRTILENTSLVNYNVVLVKVSNKHRKKNLIMRHFCYKVFISIFFISSFSLFSEKSRLQRYIDNYGSIFENGVYYSKRCMLQKFL